MIINNNIGHNSQNFRGKKAAGWALIALIGATSTGFYVNDQIRNANYDSKIKSKLPAKDYAVFKNRESKLTKALGWGAWKKLAEHRKAFWNSINHK